jgi:integrase
MAKVALNDTTLRALEPPRKGQRSVWDSRLPTFGIRISQGGSKTFVVNRHNSLITIGRYPIISLSDARVEAKRLLYEFTLGRSRPQSVTFQQAIELFLADKAQAKRPSTVYSYKLKLERLKIRGMLADFSHAEAAHKLNRITAPSEKSHVLVAGKVFFNWCIKRRYLTENPLAGITKPAAERRTRVLSDAELKSIWNACPELGTFGKIVRLCILTGQRRGELAALRAEFFDGNICNLPGTLTKNHRIHPFPVGDLCREHLPNLPPSGPLFKFNNWGQAKAQLDKLSGVTGWTLHDLRRTFRTNLGRLGVAPHVAERLVNHVSAQSEMELTYNPYAYMPEMRDAIDRWETILAKVIA